MTILASSLSLIIVQRINNISSYIPRSNKPNHGARNMTSKLISILTSVFFIFFPASIVFPSEAIIGPGCTTATLIDWDCDGYGVGSGALGPDADDNDASIHSAEQVRDKYPGGTAASDGLSIFINKVKGYTPAHYYYVSTNGDNTTGRVDDPKSPYSTIAGVRAAHTLAPDDIILVRGGTYTDNWNLSYPTTNGASGHPVIFMAYPGEKPIWDISVDFGGEPTAGNNNLIFDGLNFTNSSTKLGRTYFFGASGGAGSANIIIRNSEVWNRTNGIFAMQGLNNWLIERCSFHDTTGSHCIYLGSRNYPNTNITVKNNLLYRPSGLTGIQHNGRITGLTVASNIIWGCQSGAGISLEQGVSHSTITNNIVFALDRANLVISDYPTPPSSPDLKPYDQTSNIIANNTFVMLPLNFRNGGALASGPQPNILITRGTYEQTQDIFTNNIFRNNIIVNLSSAPPIMIRTGWATYNCAIAGSCTGSDFSCNGEDPTNKAKLITFDTNIIHSKSNTIFYLDNNLATSRGTPPYTPPETIQTSLDWSQFTKFSNNIINNINSDPLLVNSGVLIPTLPGNADFHLQPNSPASNTATPNGLPYTDITNTPRRNPSSIGAYESTNVSTIQSPQRLHISQ